MSVPTSPTHSLNMVTALGQEDEDTGPALQKLLVFAGEKHREVEGHTHCDSKICSEHEGDRLFLPAGWRREKGSERLPRGHFEISVLVRWTKEQVSSGRNDIKAWTAQPVLSPACGSRGYGAR